MEHGTATRSPSSAVPAVPAFLPSFLPSTISHRPAAPCGGPTQRPRSAPARSPLGGAGGAAAPRGDKARGAAGSPERGDGAVSGAQPAGAAFCCLRNGREEKGEDGRGKPRPARRPPLTARCCRLGCAQRSLRRRGPRSPGRGGGQRRMSAMGGRKEKDCWGGERERAPPCLRCFPRGADGPDPAPEERALTAAGGRRPGRYRRAPPSPALRSARPAPPDMAAALPIPAAPARPPFPPLPPPV